MPQAPSIPDPARTRRYGASASRAVSSPAPIYPIDNATIAPSPATKPGVVSNAGYLNHAQQAENEFKVKRANDWFQKKQQEVAAQVPAPPTLTPSREQDHRSAIFHGTQLQARSMEGAAAASPGIAPAARMATETNWKAGDDWYDSYKANEDGTAIPASRLVPPPADKSLVDRKDNSLLPGMGTAKGEQLDELGKKMGVPRGNSSLNGVTSRMEDGVYANILRQHMMNDPSYQKTQREDPEYQSVHGKVEDIKDATAAGIPAPAYFQQKESAAREASMTDDDRTKRDIETIPDPAKRAAARNAAKLTDQKSKAHDDTMKMAEKKLQADQSKANASTIGNVVKGFFTSAASAIGSYFKAKSAEAKTTADKQKVAQESWLKADKVREKIADAKTYFVKKQGEMVNGDPDGSMRAERLKEHDERMEQILGPRPNKASTATAATQPAPSVGAPGDTVSPPITGKQSGAPGDTRSLPRVPGVGAAGDTVAPSPHLPPGAVPNPDGTMTYNGITYRRKAG